MVGSTLDLDTLTTYHPVSLAAGVMTDPNEIKAIFDTISYKKGASIIHMLEATVGGDVVR